jgi:TolB protein
MKANFTFLIVFLCALARAENSSDSIILKGSKFIGSSEPVPISMSGYSGEAQSVLKFDLEVAGFEFVDADKAAFFLRGGNNGKVEGSLTDKSKLSLFAKAYTGGTTRSQSHALANDVIFAVTGVKGITQTRIAFKTAAGNSSEIFVADYDGYGATQMTSDRSEVAMPCWVPGQKKLVYCSWKNGATQIFSHDLSSGARQVVLHVAGNSYSPSVSPDGRKLAVILNKSGSPDLYVCDMNGGDLKRLTQTKEDESSPCWSPDSSTVCYISRFNERPALFTVSASGGEPRRLKMSGVGGQITEPDWSPDGKTIVFTSQGGEYFNICIVPSGGGEAAVVTDGQDPCWALNSRTVIFTRQRNNKRVLSLLDVPTKRVKDVAPISGSCSQPSWAR